MNKIIAFVDNVGRVIIGQDLGDDDVGRRKIKEPAIVNVQVSDDNGQISVQLLPFIFREFISPHSRDEGVEWYFEKCNMTTSENLDLDDNIKLQYKNIFTRPVAQPQSNLNDMEKQQAAPVEPETVKLFDDED